MYHQSPLKITHVSVQLNYDLSSLVKYGGIIFLNSHARKQSYGGELHSMSYHAWTLIIVYTVYHCSCCERNLHQSSRLTAYQHWLDHALLRSPQADAIVHRSKCVIEFVGVQVDNELKSPRPRWSEILPPKTTDWCSLVLGDLHQRIDGGSQIIKKKTDCGFLFPN